MGRVGAANTLARRPVPELSARNRELAPAKLQGANGWGAPLAKLTFCEAMLAACCVEHQIEAAAIDTLACHLHTGYRMLE
jgi:hypothetical protein